MKKPIVIVALLFALAGCNNPTPPPLAKTEAQICKDLSDRWTPSLNHDSAAYQEWMSRGCNNTLPTTTKVGDTTTTDPLAGEIHWDDPHCARDRYTGKLPPGAKCPQVTQ